jgi:hypothetical protein
MMTLGSFDLPDPIKRYWKRRLVHTGKNANSPAKLAKRQNKAIAYKAKNNTAKGKRDNNSSAKQ